MYRSRSQSATNIPTRAMYPVQPLDAIFFLLFTAGDYYLVKKCDETDRTCVIVNNVTFILMQRANILKAVSQTYRMPCVPRFPTFSNIRGTRHVISTIIQVRLLPQVIICSILVRLTA